MTRIRPTALLPLFALLVACHPQRVSTRPSAAQPETDFGVLVLAHGGSSEWNDEVLAAVQPLKSTQKLEVAFGMADAATMRDAVRALESQGVRRIGVVRLFISGESWKTRTEQILGLAEGAPAEPPAASHEHEPQHGHGGHGMGFWRIESKASFALSAEGLVEADAMGQLLVERARALSRTPSAEDVLILMHGAGDDAEQARLLAELDARAETVRGELPFRRVEVEALREDWPDKRPEAERRIRAFVTRANHEDGSAIVIPFRLQGFGPYGDVLEDLDYLADGHGLLPGLAITQWIRGQIETLECGSFRSAEGVLLPNDGGC